MCITPLITKPIDVTVRTNLACESVSVSRVDDPPCGIADYVLFYDNGCPYSGCASCEECVPSYIDQKMLEMLITSSYTWVM